MGLPFLEVGKLDISLMVPPQLLRSHEWLHQPVSLGAGLERVLFYFKKGFLYFWPYQVLVVARGFASHCCAWAQWPLACGAPVS